MEDNGLNILNNVLTKSPSRLFALKGNTQWYEKYMKQVFEQFMEDFIAVMATNKYLSPNV